MVGITEYGAYIPKLRIERQVIADAWNRGAIKGERSMANGDEDSITMAVEAGSHCLNGKNREEIDGLFFATTTSVYLEKMNSSLISFALDLKKEIETVDFANSLRGGLSALRAALNSAQSNSDYNILVTAADTRQAYPKSDEEQGFGDGSGSVLVGDKDVIATYEGSYVITNEMMDVWRKANDKYIKTWEKRFILEEGYRTYIEKVVQGILAKYGLSPENIAKIVVPAPDERSHNRVMQSLGFSMEKQVQDPYLSNLGYCGTPHPFIMLAGALEETKPGDIILLAAYGDGAEAMLFKVTDQIGQKRKGDNIQSLFQSKLNISSYATFLSFKDIVEPQPGDPYRLLPSATVSWREQNSILRCHASRCRKCGQMAYPIQRVCLKCHAQDDYDEICIANMQGKIFTFTKDMLAGRSDDPIVIQTVAEFEDQIRFYGMMTDCDPNEVKIGMPVELTFRRMYEGAGFYNYFWKLRPNRRGVY